jgi:S1-C subfamily serine protease
MRYVIRIGFIGYTGMKKGKEHRVKPIFLALVFLLMAVPIFAGDDSDSVENTPVRLHVTYQENNYSSPWKQRKSGSRSGYGCVLSSRRILTTADIVKDSTMIKVEKPSGKEYYPGRVEVIDYDIDLAVVSVQDESFFDGLRPVEMDPRIRIDQPVKFLVMENSNKIRAIPGEIVKISVENYFLGPDKYLTYGAAVNFEDRGGGWSEPVFSGDKLIGLTMSYSGKKQYATIIPASIINRFLAAARPGGYIGFPHHGFIGAGVRDPIFREYLQLPPRGGGLYISSIYPGGSADGVLREGDVLVSVDGFPIDVDGYYINPDWGSIDYRDLFSRFHSPGEDIEVGIFRGGKNLKKKIKLARPDLSDYLIPPYSGGEPPEYLIVGGLIFQELTADYLKDWGEKWQTKANKKYLYYYTYHSRRPEPGRERIVILNKILPDRINLGYQSLADLVLAEVNGLPISKIGDVKEALNHPEKGFYRFTFEEFDQELILPVDSLPAADRRIGEQYGISEMRE